MIGNLVTSLAGNAVGRALGGAAGGPAGAALGLALPFVARRLGPWGMIGMAVGSWAVARYLATHAVATPAPAAERQPIVTPPPVPMAMPADF